MKNLPLLLAAAALAALAAIAGGCQKQSAKVTSTPERVFKISVSSGGGFTGEINGCTLSSDGVVRGWTRRGAGADSTLQLTQGSVETIRGFETRLLDAKALDSVRTETGNMTAWVKYEAPDSAYAWAWPGGGENDKTPGPLKGWYSAVQAYCGEALGAKP